MKRVTERLVLEPIGPENADDLYRLHLDPVLAEYWGPWTLERSKTFAQSAGEAWRDGGVHKWLAYDRETHELIGRGGLSRLHADMFEHTWDGADELVGVLEIGWSLRGEYRGRGYATEIGREGLAFAFDELGADEVIAFTESNNERSRAVMERLGMRITAEHPQHGEPFAFYVISRPS